ncbi:MAG: OadG family protein [Lachnospiraceae bacterium]|nr:OadG family protein [Lachnospiraceae bacterium]
MALSYNTEMQITNAAFNVKYTIAENLQKAALNTLLGMGTVFVILILISLIISLFGIFPKIEASRKAKQAAKEAEKKAATAATAPAAPAAPVAEVVPEDLTDDLELVAVISAAIAAYEGSEDASGYVVRSIRKSTKWQRA